jgi:hypothetical protein
MFSIVHILKCKSNFFLEGNDYIPAGLLTSKLCEFINLSHGNLTRSLGLLCNKITAQKHVRLLT